MDDKQWQQANYPYDFILGRYRDLVQSLNWSMRDELSNLPDKLTDKELDIFESIYIKI